MDWIVMQPADDGDSMQASKILTTTGKCLLDLSKHGTRLKPIAFGSRRCTLAEENLHSFIGEAASGRWSIRQNRRYLWGCHFWWICDCSAIKEVLEYSDTIPMVCRWVQELLGYQFTVVHRSNRIMVDVDSLTRRYGPLIAMHCMVATILRQRDITLKALAYDSSIFLTCPTAKLLFKTVTLIVTPVLFTGFIFQACKDFDITDISPRPSSPVPIISSSPILYTTMSGIRPVTHNEVIHDNRISANSQPIFS